MQIRNKLFLASLSLLVIPLTGYHYVQEMAAFLRNDQARELSEQSRVVAEVLREYQTALIQNHLHDTPQVTEHIFVRPLDGPINVDGYLRDWQPYQIHQQSLSTHHIAYQKPNTPSTLSVQYQLGQYAQQVYLMLRVQDDHVVFQSPQNSTSDHSDQIRLVVQTTQGDSVQYLVSTESPGWIKVVILPEHPQETYVIESRIKGEWQETAVGYDVELSLPIELLGKQFAFSVIDVDDKQRQEVMMIVSRAYVDGEKIIPSISTPIPALQTLLSRLIQPFSRVWVIDNQQRIIAVTGQLKETNDEGLSKQEQQIFASSFNVLQQIFYRLILEQPANDFVDDLSTASHLHGPEIDQALTGESATHWRQTPDQQVYILTAAHPIWIDGAVSGVVAVEMTSHDILILRNRAMQMIINISVLAFMMAAFVLLLMGARLSMRIRRLRDETDQAISIEGRVNATIDRSTSRDELGDLSRSLAQMVQRLSQYNHYLETMAAKFSHEIRTPITIVKSSLDNLKTVSTNQDSVIYIERAQQGMQRLSNILSRMREASRLEQTLKDEEKIDFNLKQVVSACYEGYQMAFAEQRYVLQMADTQGENEQQFTVRGQPELIAQLFDKLIANANDFSQAQTEIIIRLSHQKNHLVLSVLNAGPYLPETMQHSLFDSMVSVRSRRDDQVHLGMGLYVVRLIAQFHQAQVTAMNREDIKGVIVNIIFPTALTLKK